MIRRTITLPEALAAEIDALVASGAAGNVSRFLQDAARRHVAALHAESLAAEADRLDTDDEIALARGAAPGAPGADDPPEHRIPWSSLRDSGPDAR